jgi:hypothetical protein
MRTSYHTCACGWYGPEHELERVTMHDKCEFWGQPVLRPYVEVQCPDCHREDDLSDANGPCQLCEEVPCISGTDTCAACAVKEAAEECSRCGGSGVVTLYNVDLGGGFMGDADDQPCPLCRED